MTMITQINASAMPDLTILPTEQWFETADDQPRVLLKVTSSGDIYIAEDITLDEAKELIEYLTKLYVVHDSHK